MRLARAVPWVPQKAPPGVRPPSSPIAGRQVVVEPIRVVGAVYRQEYGFLMQHARVRTKYTLPAPTMAPQ